MSKPQMPDALRTFRSEFDLRVFVDHNRGGWQMPMEWHTSFEVFLTLSGRGRYIIGERVYDFEAGDVFVISNNELHKSEVVDEAGFDACMVMFSPSVLPARQSSTQIDPLDLYFARPPKFSHRFSPNPDKRETYFFIARLMLEAFDDANGQRPEAAAALLIWLLIDLCAEYFQEGGQIGGVSLSSERVKQKKIVAQVLDYIDQHYHEDIRLAKLAASLYVTHSYLSREFKKSTGYSLVKFIANRRIREARELLRRTDMTISEISSAVGYNSMAHFHHAFKNEIGISPRDFRNLPGSGIERKP